MRQSPTTAPESTPNTNRSLRSRLRLAAGALALVGVTVTTLSACGDATPLEVGTQATTYKGRDLNCLTFESAYGYTSYECDFNGFYDDPDYVAPSAAPRVEEGELAETTVLFNGSDLHCLTFDTYYGYAGLTCDYPRFYAENPAR